MTNQEINERVAKLCGWTIKTNTGLFFDSSDKPHISLPNYAESLDACKEFEGAIGKQALEYYAENLAVAVWGSAIGNTMSYLGAAQLITATPLQRCEAFLRLKGKWE